MVVTVRTAFVDCMRIVSSTLRHAEGPQIVTPVAGVEWRSRVQNYFSSAKREADPFNIIGHTPGSERRSHARAGVHGEVASDLSPAEDAWRVLGDGTERQTEREERERESVRVLREAYVFRGLGCKRVFRGCDSAGQDFRPVTL